MYFWSTEKSRTKFSSSPNFQPLKILSVVGFPYEIRPHRSPNFDVVAAILRSTQQPDHFFVTFRPRDFVNGSRAFQLPL